MNHKNLHRKKLYTKLTKLMDTMPEARLTQNRFRSVRAVLIEVYPQLKEIPKETLLQVLLDSEYLGRRARWITEGEEKKTKVVLSQQFVLENVR